MILSVKAKKSERKGILTFGDISVPCALGPAGLVARKQEGDGGTPLADMALMQVYYREDRITRPVTDLPVTAIKPDHGWSDDPDTAEYNQLVQLPYDGSHEKMWREDHLYDICVVLDWNLSPATPGKGSAIFFHLAHEDYRPTEGCIAVSEADMRKILRGCRSGGVLRTAVEA